jgi:uncharacterized protein
MDHAKPIRVEVAYANPAEQYCAVILVPRGTTLRGVIERARLCERFPEIDLSVNRVGVYGALRELEALAQEGDRVEVYRRLSVDPKTARRQRGIRRKSPN